MNRSSVVTVPGLSLATEEVLALCDALHLDHPKAVVDEKATDTELAVARHTLVARKMAVPHNGTIVVHPALGGLMNALAAPGLLVRVEIDDRVAEGTDTVVFATSGDMIVEHRVSSAVRVHHLSVVEEGGLMERITLAAALTPTPAADVPGFAVRSGALRTALAELEKGEAGAALDALVGGGAPVRPARTFAAAVAGRVRTVVVAAVWRERETAMRATIAWVDGGSLGLWRVPGRDHSQTALVEPVTAARITAEIATSLPGRFAPPLAPAMTSAATSATS